MTRYLGSAAEIQIPRNVDGIIVAEIGESAFAGNPKLRKVEMPAAAYIIRANAFSNCTGLKEVKLPTLLETIEDNAFAGCTALAVVKIPDSVMEMGENVFAPNTALDGSADSLAPDYARACGLRYVGGAEATVNPERDYQYSIINGYAKITSYTGDDAEVIVPAELGGYPVKVIGKNAFSSRYEVEKVILPEGVTELESVSFRMCSSLKSIELPSTLLYIRDNAFYRCENLEEIEIPASLIELGAKAFTGCKQLRLVTIHANLQSMNYDTFFNCHSTLTIYAPKGSAAERVANSRGYRFVAIEE